MKSALLAVSVLLLATAVYPWQGKNDISPLSIILTPNYIVGADYPAYWFSTSVCALSSNFSI